MKYLRVILLLVCGFHSLALGEAGEAEQPPAGLVEFLQEHCKKLVRQDVEGAIKNIHSKAKERDKVILMMRGTIKQIKYSTCEIRNPRYIGSDGEYFYIRYNQTTIGAVSTADGVREMRVDADVLTVCAKQDGEWKVWYSFFFSHGQR